MSLNWSVLKIEDYKELMVKGTDKDGSMSMSTLSRITSCG